MEIDEGQLLEDYHKQVYGGAAKAMAASQGSSLIRDNNNLLASKSKGSVRIANDINLVHNINEDGSNARAPNIFSSVANTRVLDSDSDVKVFMGTTYNSRDNVNHGQST